jgi:hypothetical protein
VSDRRIELGTGIGAGLAGLLGLGYALLGPTYSYERIERRFDGTTNVTAGSASLIQVQTLRPITIAVFVLMFLLVAGFGIGQLLVPAWLLALATAALADRVERRSGERGAGPTADTAAGR